MIRTLALAGGIAGAVALSQFPEFSQQYLQRLSGAVDELRDIVLDFDATAARAGLTREEALADLSASAFQSELQATLAGRIGRYEALSADYAALRAAEPLERLTQLHRFADPDIARRTWEDFRPAVPVTSEGLICAGIGFGAGWLTVSLLLGLLSRVGRRRPTPAARGGA